MLNAKEAAELNAKEEKEEVQLPNSIKRILLALEMEIRKRIVFHNDYKLWITYEYDKNTTRDRFSDASNFDWLGSKVIRDQVITNLKNLGYMTRILENEQEIDLIISWEPSNYVAE